MISSFEARAAGILGTQAEPVRNGPASLDRPFATKTLNESIFSCNYLRGVESKVLYRLFGIIEQPD